MSKSPTPSSHSAFDTSAGISAADATVQLDGRVLGRHVTVCRACANRIFHVRRAIDGLDTFAAPRFVTTLAAFVAVLTLLGLLL